MQDLRDTDRFSYAFWSEGPAGFDIRGHLGSITTPTQSPAGVEGTVAPPSFAHEIAQDINAGGGKAAAVALDGVGHLAPAEAPTVVGELVRTFMAESGK